MSVRQPVAVCAALAIVAGAAAMPAALAADASDTSAVAGKAELELKKSINGIDAQDGATPAEVEPGKPMTITYKVRNIGTADVEKIEISDEVTKGDSARDIQAEISDKLKEQGSFALAAGAEKVVTIEVSGPAKAGDKHRDEAYAEGTVVGAEATWQKSNVVRSRKDEANAKTLEEAEAREFHARVATVVEPKEADLSSGLEISAETRYRGLPASADYTLRTWITDPKHPDQVYGEDTATVTSDPAKSGEPKEGPVKGTWTRKLTIEKEVPEDVEKLVVFQELRSTTHDEAGNPTDDAKDRLIAADKDKYDYDQTVKRQGAKSGDDESPLELKKKINDKDAQDLGKAHAAKEKVWPGERMTISYTVKNRGETPITDIRIADDVTHGATSAKVQSDIDAALKKEAAFDLAPKAERTVTIQVPTPEEAEDHHRDIAQASGKDEDGDVVESNLDEANAHTPKQKQIDARTEATAEETEGPETDGEDSDGTRPDESEAAADSTAPADDPEDSDSEDGEASEPEDADSTSTDDPADSDSEGGETSEPADTDSAPADDSEDSPTEEQPSASASEDADSPESAGTEKPDKPGDSDADRSSGDEGTEPHDKGSDSPDKADSRREGAERKDPKVSVSRSTDAPLNKKADRVEIKKIPSGPVGQRAGSLPTVR